ncbi:MAG: pyridoxal phosphate-dependent aminotransferase, partial [Mesorhizobium sp.]
FHAMDILAEANRLKAKGVPVVSMAVGQPSDPAPTGVRQAATNALKMGRIGYTDALGLAGLREAIAQHYADHYG